MGQANHLATLLGSVPHRAPYRKYLMASYAENTKLGYQADVAHFRRWGGRIPSTPMQLAQYLAAFAGKLAYATLARRVAAIHYEHAGRGLDSPAKSELVRATLRGIGRTYTRKQRQVRPLLREHLVRMIRHFRGPLGQRDKALLLLGFLGGFRRSELIALDVADVQFTRYGAAVTLRRSKTDQDAIGRTVNIPRLRSSLCAVRALECWLRVRGAGGGALFTSLTPEHTVTTRRMAGLAVAEAVKRRAAQIGLDRRQYSGHSLRAGFVTSAARAGASLWQIKQQTGHKSDAVVARYIRDGAAEGANVSKLIATR